jgi:hypothetical protein
LIEFRYRDTEGTEEAGLFRLTSESLQEKMSVMKTDSLFVVLGIIACLGMPEWVSSQQVDITALVKARNPTFEREVQKICEESCLGNERKGWLHAVSYRKIDDKNYQVYVETRFRNRHQLDPIYLLGTKVSEEGDLFNHTVIVKTRGRIDKQTCVAVVEDIWVENDFRGMFATLVEREKSQMQITTFNGCAEYLK